MSSKIVNINTYIILLVSEGMTKRFNRITHDSLRFQEDDMKKESTVNTEVEVFPPVNVNTTNSKQLDNGIIEQKTLRIQLSKDTRLLVGPGEQSNLQYDVENIRNTPVNVDIEVTGEHKFLQALSPQK